MHHAARTRARPHGRRRPTRRSRRRRCPRTAAGSTRHQLLASASRADPGSARRWASRASAVVVSAEFAAPCIGITLPSQMKTSAMPHPVVGIDHALCRTSAHRQPPTVQQLRHQAAYGGGRHGPFHRAGTRSTCPSGRSNWVRRRESIPSPQSEKRSCSGLIAVDRTLHERSIVCRQSMFHGYRGVTQPTTHAHPIPSRRPGRSYASCSATASTLSPSQGAPGPLVRYGVTALPCGRHLGTLRGAHRRALQGSRSGPAACSYPVAATGRLRAYGPG